MAFVPAGGERDFEKFEEDDFDFGGKDDCVIQQSDNITVAPGDIDVQHVYETAIDLFCDNSSEEQMRLAIINNKLESVEDILDKGFDINSILKGGWTSLMYACDYGNHDIIQLLLSRGANPNFHIDMFTCLMSLSSSKNCNNEMLTSSAELLINKGARVDSNDKHRMTPLMYACQFGHIDLARTLLSFDAGVNKQDSQGWTPLCYAASQGNLPLVNLLISSGADPQISTHLGDTPVSLALAKELTHIVDTIEKSDSGQKSRTNTSIYSDSIHYGDLELFLAGLQLGHLTSLFKSHDIKFSDLLSITDKELEDIGVTQVGLRKKILDAIADIHKTQWKMPNEPLAIKRGLSLQEYSLVLSQLSSHIDYVCSSTSFILNHTSNNSSSPVTMATEACEKEELINQIETVVASSCRLDKAVTELQQKVYHGLDRSILPRSHRKKRLFVKVLQWTIFVTSSVLILEYCRNGNRLINFFKYCYLSLNN